MKLVSVKYLLFTIVVCCIAFSAQATHLVGGSMSYQYIGRLGNGNFQYRVTLKVYRDCAASTVLFDDEITVGAYNNTGSRSLVNAFKFSKLNEIPVDPPKGADCPNPPNVCIREATYSRLIDLPSSNFGYHLIWQRCCRNTQNNIIDDMGQTYYAFIPPTNIRNSSPFFTGVPAPYICVNDTTTYLNGASDPDGDSLSYRLVHPWAGLNSTIPIQNDPPPTLDLPIDEVRYRNGYNSVIPFGNTGFAAVDANNGLTTMVPRNEGRFALAIEVTEWRNGQPLSTIRLDVQMIVIKCQPNNTPTIAPTSGTFNKTVQAGNTICFDINAQDLDVSQNITISARGEVFGGGNWTGSVATFTKKTAEKSVTSQFCWTPDCNQTRSFPYNFVVDAIDDGCPPRSRSVTFNITVVPFIGQQNITGPINVCEGDLGIEYSVPSTAGNTYKWTVIGGTIAGADNQSSVKVNWGISGAGKVRVIETSAGGCVGTPAEINITIAERPAKRALSGQDTICEFSNNLLYQVTPTINNTYKWFVSGGTIVANPQPHQIRVNWGGIGQGEIKMIETNVAGCPGDTNRFPVLKTRSLLDTLYGSPSVCPNIRGVEYYVDAQSGANYQWFVEGGTLRSGNGTPKIIVDWGDIGFGRVKVIETLKWGCVGDTVYYDVIKNHNLIGVKPIGDSSVCAFTKAQRYEVIYTNGSKYYWTVTGGTIIQDDTTNWILVDWGSAGNGIVEVYETSYDSVNKKPCIGMPVRLPVSINPLPTANDIKGIFELCQLTGVYRYTLNGFAGSTYKWSINGDTSNIQGQGTNTISVDWNLDGKYTIAVQETTKDSCTSFTVDSLVTVNKKPTTGPIIGDKIVCFPLFANHDYSTTGFPTSTYNWFINSGSINSGNLTPLINVDWTGQQDNTLKVLEISDKGCLGDTVSIDVFADHPVLKMRFVSVGFPKDDHMEMKWQLDNAPRFNSDFTIQRRDAGVTDSWRDVGTVSKNDLTFTDKNLNTDNNAFEYRIKAQDLCGQNIFSDVHTSILLTGKKLDLYEVLINWTRYKGWTDGVRTYEVYRSNDFDPSFSVSKDKGSDTTDSYTDGFDNFTQRYRIKAYENGGNGDTSWSNEIFFNFDPVIWVPNAFTPNDDGINSTFKIVYGSIKNFQINIYDRWGNFLFTTKDIRENWDGTFKGKPCPDGVYVYTIKYSGADNINKHLAGNITLLR